jgi:8-oxo-dGTP pyrophosphatase MutT (NUDIX family)
MNKYDENEFAALSMKFGLQPYIKDVDIEYSSPGYFNNIKKAVAADRRGEVVFCVQRPDGRAIAVTCKEYPEGIFRIPTGGIGYGEDIVDAVIRETKEELGLEVEILRFIGVIKIHFKYENESVMFYSYLFLLKETGGKLLEDASDDEVSEVREVDNNGLQALVNRLASIQGKWSDWGKFRFVTSNAILEYLMSPDF